MTEDMPTRWEEALERAGIGSARQLAQRANLSPSTAANIVNGRMEKVRRGTVAKLAEVLRLSEDEVYQLIRDTEEAPEVYRGPEESASLKPYQRQALDKVIGAFLRDNQLEGQTDAEKKTEPGSSAVEPGTGSEEKTNVRPLRPLDRHERLVASGKKAEPKESD